MPSANEHSHYEIEYREQNARYIGIVAISAPKPGQIPHLQLVSNQSIQAQETLEDLWGEVNKASTSFRPPEQRTIG